MRRIIFVIILFFALVLGISCMDSYAATVTVKKGDSIWKISKKHHVLFLWKEVRKLNIGRFADWNKIYPGDTVILPDIPSAKNAKKSTVVIPSTSIAPIKHIENAKHNPSTPIVNAKSSPITAKDRSAVSVESRTITTQNNVVAGAKSLNQAMEYKSNIPLLLPFQKVDKPDVKKVVTESGKHKAEQVSKPSFVSTFLHLPMKIKAAAVLFCLAEMFLILLVFAPGIVCGKPRARREKFYGHGIIADDSFILFDGKEYVFIKEEEQIYQSSEIKDVANFAGAMLGDYLVRFDVPKKLRSKYVEIESSQQKAARKYMAEIKAGQSAEFCRI